MRLRFMFLMVWLVALALPVQAIASATMAHCGQSHQRMHTAQADSHRQVSPGHDHVGHDGASQHQHDAAEAAASGHDVAQADNFTDLGTYKCSACASCCSVCALLSTMPQLAAPEFMPAVFAAVVLAVDPFAADGLERPPRIDLA